MTRRHVTPTLLTLALIVGLLAGTATAAEPGHRLSADSAQVTFLVTNQADECQAFELWLAVLVGDASALAPGGLPVDVWPAYATNYLYDQCTGELVYYYGAVDLTPDDLDFIRLDSFVVHEVEVELQSESGDIQRFTFDLAWTRTGDDMTRVDGTGTGVFQVERWVMADVTGTVVMNAGEGDEWSFSGEEGNGEISRLTQIATPTPSLSPSSLESVGEPLVLLGCFEDPPWGPEPPAAGEPFHVIHGWLIDPGVADKIGQFTFELLVDGVKQQSVLVMQALEPPASPAENGEFLAKWYLTNFPDGLSGDHTLTGVWTNPWDDPYTCEYELSFD
jgi:hypothetical protein